MSELPSVYTESFPIARKKHTCCECRRDIVKGEKYQLFKGCWEGKFKGFKTCLPCNSLRAEVAAEDDNQWPPFECLSDWAAEVEIKFPPEN